MLSLSARGFGQSANSKSSGKNSSNSKKDSTEQLKQKPTIITKLTSFLTHNDHHDHQEFPVSDISFNIDKNFVDIMDIDNMDQKSPELFMKRAIRNARLDVEPKGMAELRFSIIPH